MDNHNGKAPCRPSFILGAIVINIFIYRVFKKFSSHFLSTRLNCNEKIIQEARKEAERERYKIVDGAKKEVAEMVTMAAEKLLINSTVSDNYEQFLEEAERSVRSESSK